MPEKVWYYEPKHRRMHAKIDCAVILGQTDIELIIVARYVPLSRPCSLCGRDEPPPPGSPGQAVLPSEPSL